MAYRDRSADAATIRNWISGRVQQVSNAVGNIGVSVVDSANAIFGKAQGAITDFVNNAMPVALSALGQLSYSGSSGNYQSATEPIVLYAKFFNVSWSEDVNYIGHIAQGRDIINRCPGFNQIDNPRIEIPGLLLTEEEAIETYMRGGFYFE